MSNKLYEESSIQAIANSIRAKNGSSDTYTVAEMPEAIDNLTLTPPKRSDVNFYDYDGTLLYSYSAAEIADLTAMPILPSHSGLVSEGWNWTLADLKTQVNQMGVCEVGALYITDNNQTRLYLSLDDPKDLEILINIYFATPSSAIVAWGDGYTSVINGEGAVQGIHTYATAGNYIISIAGNSNYCLGGGTATLSIMDSTESPYFIGRQKYLKKIELANNCIRISSYGLQRAINLESIAMHSHIDSYQTTSSFNECTSLKHLTLADCNSSYFGTTFLASCYQLRTLSLPKTLPKLSTQAIYSNYSLQYDKFPIPYTWNHFNGERTYAFSGLPIKTVDLSHFTVFGGNSAFQNCRNLESIILPEGTADTANSYKNTFYNCPALKYVTLPSTVTVMGANTLARCGSLKEIHIKAVNPPTITNTTLSDSSSPLPSDCKIYVPKGSGAAYKAASNWSSFGSQIFEEE